MPCGGGLLFEWVEHSLDVLICDDETKKALPNALGMHSGAALTSPKPDYTKQHDEFLESLLQEQTERAVAQNSCADDSGSVSSMSTMAAPPLLYRRTVSDLTPTSAGPTFAAPTSGKKRRPTIICRNRQRVHSSPWRKKQVYPGTTPATDDDESQSSAPSPFLSDLSEKRPPPETYLHAYVKLQKDKGKGEAPGTEICASGRQRCLGKLRQKMELLTHVALGDPEMTHKTPANSGHMKRRKARIAEDNHMYTETRSLIELRMGFLSMQYGVLIQWTNGLAHLVVLRKMCSDSFYKKLKVHKQVEATATITTPLHTLGRSTLGVFGDSHAMVEDCADGMEVALLDPPFRVPRPVSFRPSFLKVSVVCMKGWKENKSNYSLQFEVEGMLEKCRLNHHEERDLFVPRVPETMEWEVPLEAQLDIKLYVHRRRQKHKRLVRTLPVPLSSLTPQTSPARPRKLELPLNKQGAFLILLVAYQSDYAHWLQKEVTERKREEASACTSWQPPCTRLIVEPEEEKERDTLFDICCVW